MSLTSRRGLILKALVTAGSVMCAPHEVSHTQMYHDETLVGKEVAQNFKVLMGSAE